MTPEDFMKTNAVSHFIHTTTATNALQPPTTANFGQCGLFLHAREPASHGLLSILGAAYNGGAVEVHHVTAGAPGKCRWFRFRGGRPNR
eukprot:4226808-Amphidinium_carterae.1